MARGKKHTAEIVKLLRQVEVGVGKGKALPQACKEAELVERTHYRWRKGYGGLKVDQARRLKDLGTVGRPAGDNRRFVHGVLWVLRGMRWQDMPERYGMYKTTHKRFTRWAATGVGGPGLRRSSEGPGEPVHDDRFQCRSCPSAGGDGTKKWLAEIFLARS